MYRTCTERDIHQTRYILWFAAGFFYLQSDNPSLNGEGIPYLPSADAMGSSMGAAMESVTVNLYHIMLYRVHLA